MGKETSSLPSEIGHCVLVDIRPHAMPVSDPVALPLRGRRKFVVASRWSCGWSALRSMMGWRAAVNVGSTLVL